MNRLTFPQKLSRIHALNEAIAHLDSDWTDDPEEKRQGQWVQSRLRDLVTKTEGQIGQNGE